MDLLKVSRCRWWKRYLRTSTEPPLWPAQQALQILVPCEFPRVVDNTQPGSSGNGSLVLCDDLVIGPKIDLNQNIGCSACLGISTPHGDKRLCRDLNQVSQGRVGELGFRCRAARCHSVTRAAMRAPPPITSRISKTDWLPSILPYFACQD